LILQSSLETFGCNLLAKPVISSILRSYCTNIHYDLYFLIWDFAAG
jgi:hypothetical protein